MKKITIFLFFISLLSFGQTISYLPSDKVEELYSFDADTIPCIILVLDTATYHYLVPNTDEDSFSMYKSKPYHSGEVFYIMGYIVDENPNSFLDNPIFIDSKKEPILKSYMVWDWRGR